MYMHAQAHPRTLTYVHTYTYIVTHALTRTHTMYNHNYCLSHLLLSLHPPPLMYSETLLSLHQTFLLALSQACSSSNPCLGGIFQVVLPQLQSYADFITLKRRYARRVRTYVSGKVSAHFNYHCIGSGLP